MNYELFSHPHISKNIYLIDMTRERGHFSEIVEQSITKHMAQKKKILLIVNKKGYASGLFCTSCGQIPQCTHCSVSIAYYDIAGGTKELNGLCHICKRTYLFPETCSQCDKSDTLKLYGLTIQKTAEWITNTYNINPLIVESSVVASIPKIERLLPQIKKSQITIATNIILSCSLEFDLVILLAADQSLTLPDYGVRSDTFSTLYSFFTRFSTKNFLVQSYDTQHPVLRLACKLDKSSFEIQEQEFRGQYFYPPFGELCVIKYKNENETTLHNSINNLHKELEYLKQMYEVTDITMYTTPPLVYKKFGKFYYHIVLLGPMGKVRPFMDICFSKLQMRKRGFKIDRMAKGLV